MTDFQIARRTARGGPVTPPVRAVLDEALTVCPINNLPDLYSRCGSYSIAVMTAAAQPGAEGLGTQFGGNPS